MTAASSHRVLRRLLGVDREPLAEAPVRGEYSTVRRALAGLVGVRLTRHAFVTSPDFCAPTAISTDADDNALTESERRLSGASPGHLFVADPLRLLFIALAAIAYVAAVAIFFALVAPLVATAATLYVVGDLVVGYFRWIYRFLILRMNESEPVSPYQPGAEENGPEPAYRQYFFGPAMWDLQQTIMLTWQRIRSRVATHGTRFTSATLTAPSLKVISRAIRLSLWAGLICGALVGGALVAAITLVYAIVLVCAQLMVHGCVAVLRPADSLVLHARGIAGNRCPWCYQQNKYPTYRCSNCNRHHHDMRPGQYGVLRHRCTCGQRMPTLLLPHHRLPGYCAYCDRQVHDETGRFHGVVLPIIGDRGAGKTRLTAAILVSLNELAISKGAVMVAANTRTLDSYHALRTILYPDVRPVASPSGISEAYSVRLRTGKHTDLVHIIDITGERFTQTDRTDELRYLQEARTFLFVLDPMSAPGFRDSLPDAGNTLLVETPVSTVGPEIALAAAVGEMTAIGVQLRRSRLAVAISKADLIEGMPSTDGRKDENQLARRWLSEQLGLTSLIRTMDFAFRDVRFFFTAAVADAPGGVHSSITPLVAWLLSTPSRKGTATHPSRAKLPHRRLAQRC